MFHPKERLGDAVINFCLKLLADELAAAYPRKFAFKDTNFFKSRTRELLNGNVQKGQKLEKAIRRVAV